ncbi:MAG: efflux RND transporter periplasmic adaptor subunit [Bacteroidales bacterium]|nr:efflux RND transporter periplasmic adaptor subunit [Bacteroidales bacterium]
MKLRNAFLPLSTAIALCSCGHSADQDGLGHHHEHGHEGGEMKNEISLCPETADKFGVKTETIQPGPFSPALKVSGEITSSSSSQGTASARSTGVITVARGIEPGATVRQGQAIASVNGKGMAGGDINAQAKASMDAARRELDRLEPLYKEGIVSARDYNAAVAAYEQAKASYSGSSSGSGVTAPIAGVITDLLVKTGQVVNAGDPVAVISQGNGQLTLRADVPARYRGMLASIAGANVVEPQSGTTVTAGRGLSNAANTPAQGGYIPVTFSFDGHGTIPAGTFVDVYLIENAKTDALTVPIAAITEQNGEFYVYRQIDEDCYEKLLVKLGASDGQRVEITSGVEPGMTIVVKGATVVKLAESSAAVPEGHSHNH